MCSGRAGAGAGAGGEEAACTSYVTCKLRGRDEGGMKVGGLRWEMSGLVSRAESSLWLGYKWTSDAERSSH